MPGRFVAGALLVVSLALVAGCASEPDVAQSAPRGAEAASEAPLSLVTYACERGATVRAAYPTSDSALVRYRGDSREMHIARSASGARYVADTTVWWTKGSGPGATATLYRRNDSSATGEALEHCRETGPAD